MHHRHACPRALQTCTRVHAHTNATGTHAYTRAHVRMHPVCERVRERKQACTSAPYRAALSIARIIRLAV